jgi:uncharacterized protein (DUF1015 family)
LSWLLPVTGSVIAQTFAEDVVPPSYESITKGQRLAIMEAHPRTFFHATSTARDYPGTTSDGVLASARAYIQQQRQDGAYVSFEDAMFVYRISENERTIQGVVGDVRVDLMGERVLRHEKTRVKREEEILRYLETVGFECLPVSLTYRSTPDIARAVAEATVQAPIVDLTLSDGSHHLVWPVMGKAAHELTAMFDEVDRSYITDGHHRTAAAKRHSGADGGAFLAVAFPDDDVHVFPYHRWIDADLPAGHGLNMAPAEELSPPAGYATVLTAEGSWLLYLDPQAGEDDTLALARVVFRDVFGVADTRTDPRLKFVPGSEGVGAVEELVARKGGTGLILHGTTIERIMKVADEGGVMPAKSTWFEPKPRSGIFIVPR